MESVEEHEYFWVIKIESARVVANAGIDIEASVYEADLYLKSFRSDASGKMVLEMVGLAQNAQQFASEEEAAVIERALCELDRLAKLPVAKFTTRLQRNGCCNGCEAKAA